MRRSRTTFTGSARPARGWWEHFEDWLSARTEAGLPEWLAGLFVIGLYLTAVALLIVVIAVIATGLQGTF